MSDREENKHNVTTYEDSLEEKDFGRTTTGASGASEAVLSEKDMKKLYLKIDFLLLPILCLLYACALLDRVNISAARVDGMGKDLGLLNPKQNYYSIVLLVFFPAYFLFEVPSNVFLRRLGTRYLLSTVCLAFGVVSIGAGFVKNWQTLAVLRVLLGAAEGSFFPGAVYLITCWYPRYALQLRLTIFYMTGALLSGFSGLIASAISKMNGRGGLAGWRWIFICEGIATCIFAIIGFFVISDFPQDAAWLNDRERRAVIQLLERDRHDAKNDHKHITIKETLKFLAEGKLWYYGTIFGCATTSTYALAYFLPVIINGMGYKAEKALVLSSPPYIAAIPYALIISYFSDKAKSRGPFIIFNTLMVVVGLALVGYVVNNKVRYFGIFLAVAAANVNIPMTIGFSSNNIVGNGRRAVGTAVQTGWGAIGGIVASTIFIQKEAPKYRSGIATTIALTALLGALVGFQSLYYRKQNKRVDAGELILYDTPGFRYTL
jgi:MFS family permease